MLHMPLAVKNGTVGTMLWMIIIRMSYILWTISDRHSRDTLELILGFYILLLLFIRFLF